MRQVVAHLLQAHELVTFGSSPRIVSASASHQRSVSIKSSWREVGGVLCSGIPAGTLYRKHTSVTHPKQIDAAIDRNHDLIGNAVEYEKEECM